MADVRTAVIREQHKKPNSKRPNSDPAPSPSLQLSPTIPLQPNPTQSSSQSPPKRPRRTSNNAPRSKRTVQPPPTLVPIIIQPITPRFQPYTPPVLPIPTTHNTTTPQPSRSPASPTAPPNVVPTATLPIQHYLRTTIDLSDTHNDEPATGALADIDYNQYLPQNVGIPHDMLS